MSDRSTTEGARAPRTPTRVFGVLLAVIGVFMAGAGACLVYLGGTGYDLVIGVFLTISGVLIARDSERGAFLYFVLTLAACGLAVWQVGLDGLPLIPRTGLYLFLLVILGLLWPGRRPAARVAAVVVGLAGLVTVGVLSFDDKLVTTPRAATAAPAISVWDATDDWTDFGRTTAGTRFAPGGQITTANVDKLEVAWTYRTGDLDPGIGLKYSEATPLKVGDTIYLCGSFNQVFAIDAVTGKERWRFDPKLDRTKLMLAACRGVSYYKAPEGAVTNGKCATRIIEPTIDFRMFALDAETGELCADFGNNGEVNLGDNFPPLVPNYALGTSPPTIVDGLAVVGHMIMDNQGRFSPSGVVRAYDAITGQVRWAWDIGRPGQTEPLPPGENYTANTPNAWTVFAADEALGLVYVPTGGAPPDYFGGMRTAEDEKFGSSVVALDVKTGQVRWSFQAVHHDVWDYDIGSQPTLVDFPTPDGPVPALIQPTKTGQLFVFDRRDGTPLIDIEERPAPGGGVPEERLAKTQPYAVGMPDMGGGPDLTENDTWGVSPIDRVLCSIQFHNSIYEGRYTPMSLKPSLLFPGYSGGMDWGGVAVDTDRNVMIVNTIRVANRNWLVTRAEADASGVKPLGPGVLFPAVFPATQEGTPYGARALSWFSVLRMPCHAPPWGTISGIDLKTRQIIWTRPFGTSYDSGPLRIKSRIPLPTGVPNQGGAVVTAGGVTFIAATLDEYLRAFDTQTGKELWRFRLPAGAQASPISYMHEGKQYVVIFAGGHANLRTTMGDFVLAFSLPEAKAQP